jgi:hypothetical protein
VKAQLRRNSTEAKRAEAQEVIDILNRWDARMNGHQTQKRSHERVPTPATGRASRIKRGSRFGREMSPHGGSPSFTRGGSNGDACCYASIPTRERRPGCMRRSSDLAASIMNSGITGLDLSAARRPKMRPPSLKIKLADALSRVVAKTRISADNIPGSRSSRSER